MSNLTYIIQICYQTHPQKGFAFLNRIKQLFNIITKPNKIEISTKENKNLSLKYINEFL